MFFKEKKNLYALKTNYSMQQYYENRLSALAAQKAAGVNLYPHKFEVGLSIPEYVKRYEDLNRGDRIEDVEERVAGTRRCFVHFYSCSDLYVNCCYCGLLLRMFLIEGRLMNKGSSSSKLFFYDLHGGGAKVLVIADAR